MTKVTKKQFLADVMYEINTLRQITTAEERENLDFDTLDPEYPTQCIYGQLTGSCESLRAKELMDQACIRIMNLKNGTDELYDRSYYPTIPKPYSEIVTYVNGKNEGQGWDKEYVEEYGCFRRNYSHLSVLEAYINLKDSKNKEILAYIKGEIDTLKL